MYITYIPSLTGSDIYTYDQCYPEIIFSILHSMINNLLLHQNKALYSNGSMVGNYMYCNVYTVSVQMKQLLILNHCQQNNQMPKLSRLMQEIKCILTNCYHFVMCIYIL